VCACQMYNMLSPNDSHENLSKNKWHYKDKEPSFK